MLNKEEKYRLAAFLGATRADLEKDVTYASEYYVSSVRWLAEKLEEVQEELEVAQKEIERLKEFDQPATGVQSAE